MTTAAKGGEAMPPNTRHQRRSDRTRRKLVKAAGKLFAEKGIDRTTVDDVTEQADLGRGTFYYYFTDMSELVNEAVKDVLTELVKEVQTRSLARPDLAGRIEEMVGAHVDFFSQRWEDFVLYYQGRADLTLGEGFEGLETPFMDYLTCIEGLIDSALTQPVSRPALRRIACAIAGFLSGYYSLAVIASSSEDVDKTFMSLRSAFVASLVRFVTEAVPDSINNNS